MDFERAIYRVYERCMDGIREDDPESLSPKSCKLIENFIFGLFIIFLFILCYLHISFVGSAGCLPDMLILQKNPLSPNDIQYYHHNESIINAFNHENLTVLNLRTDQILQIDVIGSFVSSSTSSSYNVKKKTNSNKNNSDNYSKSDSNSFAYSKISYVTSQSIFMIQYMCSLLNLNYLRKSQFIDNSNIDNSHKYIRNLKQTYISNQFNEKNVIDNDFTSIVQNVSDNNDKYPHEYDTSPHLYEFAFNIGILALPKEIRQLHNFQSFNVTLQGSECFGNSLTRVLIPMGGLDTIIKNFIQNTFNQRDGTLVASTGNSLISCFIHISLRYDLIP